MYMDRSLFSVICLSWYEPRPLNVSVCFNLRKKYMIILEIKRKVTKCWYLGGGIMHSGPLRTSGSIMSSILHKRSDILLLFSFCKMMKKWKYINGFSISPSELYIWLWNCIQTTILEDKISRKSNCSVDWINKHREKMGEFGPQYF